MPHELETIPEGRAGLDAKVRKIRALVEAAKRDPAFRERAAAIVASVPQRDQVGEITAIFDFVRDGVRYLRDPWAPEGLELFTAPAQLLRDVDAGTAAGDCDDHVILASALLETIGYRTRYRIGGLPPDHFRHIWLEVQSSGGWLPLELVKKDEPAGYDPSHRFPLTLTLDGVQMFDSSGLGGQGGFKRSVNRGLVDAMNAGMKAARVARQASGVVQSARASRGEGGGRRGGGGDRLSRAVPREQRAAAGETKLDHVRAAERASLTNTRLPSSIGKALVEAGGVRAFDRLDPAVRQRIAEHASRPAPGRNGQPLLGDYEVPPSFTNTPQEERWFGYTPSDVWRNDELADDALGLEGFGKKLRKLQKKTKAKAKKLAKQAVKVHRKLLDPREHLKMLKKGVKGVGSLLKSPRGNAPGGEATGDGGQMLQPMPYRDTGATGLVPPSMFDESGGGGGGGGFEGSEPYDPWGQWDAQTEDQEVDSLYTPATAAEMGPDAEMPGEGEGSFVPTPDWEATTNPFDDPATGDEGMDYDAMDVSDPTAVYGQNEGSGMLGDWMTDLVQQVGSTVLTYQQARLQKKAADKGYPALQFGATVPPAATTPVPSVPAQPPASIVVQMPEQQQQPRRRAGSAALGKWGPIAMVGIGVVVLGALVMGSRRSR